MNAVQKRLRALHRDVGMFVLFLTLVYALSGGVLLFRDRGLLKVRQVQTHRLKPGLSLGELKAQLKLRRITVLRDDEVQIEFKRGRYDKLSGVAEVGSERYWAPIAPLVHLHKLRSSKPMAGLGVAYGLALAFLALSGLWMHPARSRLFRRGLWISGAGTALVVGLLLLV